MKYSSILGALATTFVFSGGSQAALVYQSEFSSYSVDATGAMTAAVKVYLAQTEGTTTLSEEDGLNSAKLSVVAASGSAPVLVQIQANPAFNFSNPNVTAGTLYVEMNNFTTGVPAIDNRIYVGTFTYAGYATVDPITTFTIEDAPSDDTFTVAGTQLDGLVLPGTFTVTVPEPASLAGLMLGGLLLMGRRRCAEM